jgi:hypothetical protein
VAGVSGGKGALAKRPGSGRSAAFACVMSRVSNASMTWHRCTWSTRLTCCDSALIVDGSYNSHMLLSVRILDLTAIRNKHAHVNMWSHVPHCTKMRVSTEMRLLTRRASRDVFLWPSVMPAIESRLSKLGKQGPMVVGLLGILAALTP